ncbi:hypothetical protein ACFLZZ_04470 [Nanoarchaeota archaeon]
MEKEDYTNKKVERTPEYVSLDHSKKFMQLIEDIADQKCDFFDEITARQRKDYLDGRK